MPRSRCKFSTSGATCAGTAGGSCARTATGARISSRARIFPGISTFLRRISPAVPLVFDHEAAALDEVDHGVAGEFLRLGAGYAALEPDALGAGGDGIAGDIGAELRAAEDGNHVELPDRIGKSRITAPAEDLLVVGVDRDDLVPGRLQV